MSVGTPIGSYREKSMSMTPLTSRVSADMTSEGSSTSDEERRRSGSVEGHHHSPDHLRGSMVSRFYTGYFILACNGIPKLGRSGACSPRTMK